MPSRWDPFATAPKSGGGRTFSPAADVFETEDAMLVKIELPGVAPEDVTLDCEAGTLAVCGRRRPEAAASGRVLVHQLERAHGAFARMLVLPPAFDGAGAVAVMNDGVLTVRIPRRGRGAGARQRAGD